MPDTFDIDLGRHSRRLRVDTIVRLRWLAVIGQTTTIVVTHFILAFPLPLAPCLLVISASALLNLGLRLGFGTQRSSGNRSGIGDARLRHSATLRPALHDRRHRKPVFDAFSRADHDFGGLAVGRRHPGPVGSDDRRGDGPDLLPLSAALVSGRGRAAAVYLQRRHLGRDRPGVGLHRRLCLACGRRSAQACRCPDRHRTCHCPRAASDPARRFGRRCRP